MARRRVIDWVKLSAWAAGKSWPQILTFQGILGTVDDFGLAAWSPSRVAMFLMQHELDRKHVSINQVGAIMEGFIGGNDPEIVTWTAGDRRYLAVCKHQDYQKCRLPRNADCPVPPLIILQKLSAQSRRHITEHLHKFTSASGGQITEFEGPARACAARQVSSSLPPLPSGLLEDEDEVEEEGAVSVKPPTPTALANAFLKGAFTEAHRQALPRATKVPIRFPADTVCLAAEIKGGWTPERLARLLPTYFASQDRLIRDNGYRAADFIRLLAGLELAADDGRTHGASGLQSRGRAHRAAPAEVHGPSGEVTL